MPSPYYSALRRAIERMTTQSAPGEQWLNTLRNTPGVKQSQVADIGLDHFLTQERTPPRQGYTLWGGGENALAVGDENAAARWRAENPQADVRQEPLRNAFGHVRREDILDYLDENDVELDDVLLGGPPNTNITRPSDYSDLPTRAEIEERIARDFDEDISELGSEYESDAFYESYERPPWDIVQGHPYRRPPAPPNPNQAEMFPDENLGSREEWYVIDPRRDDYTINRLLQEGLLNDLLDADGAIDMRAWRGALPDDFNPESAPTYSWASNHHYGPHATREDALNARDSMWDHLEEGEREAFYNSDEAHRAYQRAREEIIQREIGQGEYIMFVDEDGVPGPRWAQYSIPGGKNYGELIITQNARDEGALGYPSHFEEMLPDENAIAHVRFKRRVDAQGEPITLAEEFQSDIHQRGRERGYREPALVRAESAALKELYEVRDKAARFLLDAGAVTTRDVREKGNQDLVWALTSVNTPDSRRLSSALQEAIDRAHEARLPYNLMPNAPLKNNVWAETALKRMIRFVVDQGENRIAWTPGNVKNGMIHSGPVAGADFYDKILPNIANRLGKKFGTRVTRVTVPTPRGNVEAHVLEIPPEMADEYRQGISTYAGVDPTRVTDVRQALQMALMGGGYWALLSTLAERLRQERAGSRRPSA